MIYDIFIIFFRFSKCLLTKYLCFAIFCIEKIIFTIINEAKASVDWLPQDGNHV